MSKAEAGVCHIKEEFKLHKPRAENENTTTAPGKHKLEENANGDTNTDGKKQKTDGKPVKNKNRGQNKARPKTYRDEKENKACPTIVNITSESEKKPCTYKDCKYIHNPLDYLKIKPEDIGTSCHLFDTRGRCPRGIACRFGSSHITKEGFNLVDQEKVDQWKDDTKNVIQPSLQTQLQKKQYNFDLSEKMVRLFDTRNKQKNINVGENENNELAVINTENVLKTSGAVTDEDIIKVLAREKKVIDWTDKLYLSPLTTVGNLPFRRICKEYGADITCGEMALCEALLKGLKQEWALVKRHESEDLFGAQICGNNAYLISKVAQILQENSELDFIDLNLGCPIDLVYKKGGGCGMMHRLSALENTVKSTSKLLTIPFTVKMRTGVYQDKKITHTIVPKMHEWGASLITVHGRSREARYTRLSDWEYIEQCAKAADPCPVYGNGDIMSYEDFVERRQTAPTVKGVMIGRGALIKPWLFTEIKEQRLWDIRSSERFEILKKYTNYGLEHWGSDTQGVENTRRFLLEWLSFLYRYIPVSLLERPPQKINERPAPYFGRDDMETLMASPNCSDWVKISEMLLGPVPNGFIFLPKHRANSY